MTSRAQTFVASPPWKLQRTGRQPDEATTPELAHAGRWVDPGSAPNLGRTRRRRRSELAAGALLAVAWIALWTVFVLGVAGPGARLHARSAPSPQTVPGALASSAVLDPVEPASAR